ncbi:molybdate ABC transporter ATP-binding protein ModF [Salmonella enterica subsp. enterica]|uniref:Molybdate ABC transporter ATP-binding protein ModF n=1 Tax=Salmonella enterica subsp. enterica serovar Macclesfield str. S-1643 TaxID=1242107 RepID=A0A2C9P260_SALET|nr:molybdate ABC transporter ATP-binding protein ModF [Salmonella enterica]EAA5488088.1 molybdate ABC transporter ATP-binding protein ModF [Salmonella enterica subsp. enterica serovar Kouka]EBG2395803.1 molybdate ABC transporter ATP-binding protein ModF [Salmonella enterica subsp. enterica serovar Everleigh]EBS1109569.1 molybdate ABC transporter ATP-binding protein ModF [Salmonella enterica subsp. enterica serovar Eingedi]EBV2194666.1 molybdate ABC transporter ATP-binding protein ModF [Salmonel
MSSLQISQGTFRLSDTKTLHLDSLTLNAGDSWAFVGANGSGKSALARALAGELPLLTGERQCRFTRITRLSFEQLQKLVSDEWQRNNTDMLSPGEDDTGRTTAEIIQGEVHHPARCTMLAQQFGISALLNRRFKYLSTGETRKALLCQALMSEPELLILDEPFDGLDVTARQQLAQRLTALNQAGITLALVLNRFDEIPDFVQFAGVLADCTLAETGTTTELLQRALVAQLAHSEHLTDVQLPEPDEPSARHALPDSEPRIVLNDGVVSYNDRPILHHLSWRVNPGEHWQIVGPNGAGKSTLLSLITGDHPQGYSNDLTLFGRRRGSGETIWDIKKHIGYVSSSLHLDYRVSTTVRNVILSGYFDSIGIYQAVSDRQRKLAQQWLDILGIDKRTADAPFHSLSWGQQRLALIVRALVKHPTVLILDEPLQGLDPLNRQLVRRFVDVLIRQGETQLLFVSHHAEDAPACITHRLEFVPEGERYKYVSGRCNN